MIMERVKFDGIGPRASVCEQCNLYSWELPPEIDFELQRSLLEHPPPRYLKARMCASCVMKSRPSDPLEIADTVLIPRGVEATVERIFRRDTVLYATVRHSDGMSDDDFDERECEECGEGMICLCPEDWYSESFEISKLQILERAWPGEEIL